MDAVCLAIATVSLLAGPVASELPTLESSLNCNPWMPECIHETPQQIADGPPDFEMCDIVGLSGTPPRPGINWACIERPLSYLPPIQLTTTICEG